MRALPLALVVAALVLAALPAQAQSPPGGGDGSVVIDGITTPRGACSPPTSERVIACDVQFHNFNGAFHMVPDRIDARQGDTLKIQVSNLAKGVHNLVVCGDGAPPSVPEKCAAMWAFTQDLPENATKVITVSAIPKSGTFYFFCMKTGHSELGMRGELKVAANGEAKKSGGEAVVGTVLALVAMALVARRR